MLVWTEATKQQQSNTINPLIFLLGEKWLDHMKNHTQFLPLLNPHLSHKQSGIFHGHNVVPACICTTQPARSSTCGLCYLRTSLHLQRLWAIPSEANGFRFHLNTYLPIYFSPATGETQMSLTGLKVYHCLLLALLSLRMSDSPGSIYLLTIRMNNVYLWLEA